MLDYEEHSPTIRMAHINGSTRPDAERRPNARPLPTGCSWAADDGPANPAPRPDPANGRPVAEVEHRRHRRVPLCTRVGMSTASNLYKGYGLDISEGGIFVASDMPLAVGTEVEIAFTLLGCYELNLTGTVRWVRRPGQDGPTGMGIEFGELCEPDRIVIEEFASMRTPIVVA